MFETYDYAYGEYYDGQSYEDSEDCHADSRHGCLVFVACVMEKAFGHENLEHLFAYMNKDTNIL